MSWSRLSLDPLREGYDVPARWKRRFQRTLVCAAIASGIASAAWGALSVYMSPEEVAGRSPLIVQGTVSRVASGLDPFTGAVATYITLEIRTVHRGPSGLRTLTLREPGGTYGDLVNTVDAVPVYTPGEEVFAFLEPAPDGALRTTGMFFGKYTVEKGESGRGETARRDLDGRGLMLGRPSYRPERIRTTDLEALAAGWDLREESRPTKSIQRGAGARRDRQRTARKRTTALPDRGWKAAPPEMRRLLWNPGEAPGNALERQPARGGPKVSPFTSLSSSSPARWYEIDTGLTLPVDVEPGGNPLGDDAAAVSAMERAMAAWTDVPESRVALALGNGAADFTGAHASSPAAVYAPGANIMLFDDPYNDITDPSGCSGVLAIGGYWSSSAAGPAVNGVTYRRALSLYVIFNNNFQCFLGNADNLAEVAAHELGHALGLGHSPVPDAIMAASAGGNGRGARLGEDDMDAVHCIYPHTLTLASPLGGETWTGGGTGPITWSATAEAGPDPGSVDLEYSADGGAHWQPVTAATPNDGFYNWTVVNSPGDRYRVRVIRHNRVSPTPSPWPDACSSDGSVSDFSVLASPLGSIGSSLRLRRVGAQVTLEWNGSGSGAVDDYAVYEGNLALLRTGSWDHAPSTCNAGIDLAETILPLPGDRYFLVSPLSGATEGNLGSGSDGILRPESASACGTRE